jgi:hypothetical protein
MNLSLLNIFYLNQSSYCRYKLNFVASNRTVTTKMFCFDTIARHIVGKSCDSLVKFSSGSSKIPHNLVGIVSLKFAFVVTTTNRSFDVPEKVFQIEYIVATYGDNKFCPRFHRTLNKNHLHHQRFQPPAIYTSHLQLPYKDSTKTYVKVKILMHYYLQIFLKFSFPPLLQRCS